MKHFIGILLLVIGANLAAQSNLKSDTLRARQYLEEARELHSKGHLLATLEKLREGRRLYEKHNLREEALGAYIRETQYFSAYRRWDSTMTTVDQAEVYYAKHWGERATSARLVLGLTRGGTLINMGRDDEGIALIDSLERLREREKIAMTGADAAYLFRSLYFRAYGYLHKSEYATAELYAERAMQVCRGLTGDFSEGEASIYYLLVDIYSFTEAYSKIKKGMRPYLERTLGKYGANSPQAAEAYEYIAFSAYILKDYDLASRYYELSEAIYKSLISSGKGEYKMALARLYSNMGIGYKDSYYHVPQEQKKGQLEKAERCLKACLAGLEEMGELRHSVYGNSARGLGFVYYEWERNREALHYFQRSVLSQIAGMSMDKDDDYLPDFSDPKLSYPNFFVLFWNIESKASAYWALYERDGNIAHVHQIIRHMRAMEVLFERHFTQVVDNSDQMRMLGQKIVFYNRWIKCLHLLYEQTGEQKYVWEAFKVAEKSKASLLFSSLRNQQNAIDNGVPAELQEKEKNLRSRMALLQKRLADASRSGQKAATEALKDSLLASNKEFEQLLVQLKNEFPSYYQWKYQRQVDTWEQKEIEKQFSRPDELFVEYFVQHENLYIITLHQQKWQFLRLNISADSINKNANRLHNILANNSLLVSNADSSYQIYTESAFLLYNQLIAPLNIPKTVKKLVIIPDGGLHYIPFEALLKAKAPENLVRYAELDFLIKDYIVRYHYSMELLLLQQQKYNKNTGNIAAFAAEYRRDSAKTAQKDSFMLTARSGYARQLRSSLAPLPNAAKEVEFLQKNYHGNYFLGASANEKTFKNLPLADYNVLHLAMHGLVNDKNPSESSLAFSEDRDSLEDNFFYAYEIKQHNIPTQLVVLSACETGCGKYANGEGVISLARSFLYAGSPNVVMTLWAINDQTTASLMALFYQHLHKGLPIDEALRAAKLQYLQEMKDPLAAHPMFWAPFVHVGQPQTVYIHAHNDSILGHWLYFLIPATAVAVWFALKRKTKK